MNAFWQFYLTLMHEASTVMDKPTLFQSPNDQSIIGMFMLLNGFIVTVVVVAGIWIWNRVAHLFGKEGF